MKQFNLKRLSFPLVIFLACIAFVIHSCKKDNKTVAIADPVVNQAKQWYEATYSTPMVRAVLQVNRNAPTAGKSVFDYTKYIKPDWQHGASYTRFNAAVVELPVDPSSPQIGSALGYFPNGNNLYKPRYSRSSFLVLNDSAGYHAYIMTIIADSAYMNGDLSKLDRNKYNKRDADFSGAVLYSSPNGNYVNGWVYKNGNIVWALPPPSGQNTPAAVNANETITPPATQTGRFKNNTRLLEITTCYTWTETNTVPSCSSCEPVVIDLGTTCTTDYIDDGGGGSGGSGGSVGASGGSGGAPSTPQPCNVPPAAQNASVIPSNNYLSTRVAQTPPGFPPPTSTTNPCPDETVAVASAEDANPVKPCALKFKNITSNWMAVAVSGYTFGIEDNVFGTKFITFNIQIGMPNYVSVQQAQNASAAAMLFAEAYIAQTHGVDFFLSAGAQVTYSKEFASIVQAQLIATLGLPGVQVQNAITAGVPIITYANNNCN